MTQQSANKTVPSAMENFLNETDLSKMIEEYRKATTGRIKYLMRKRHIGQEQLADMMGIKQSHISRIVTGKMNVTIDILIKMLYFLDASLDLEDDKSKSIAVFWSQRNEFSRRLREHNEKCREKYSLQYINSAPTLVSCTG